MAQHARSGSGALARARAGAALVLGAVALGGAVGLLLGDSDPSAASLPRTTAAVAAASNEWPEPPLDVIRPRAPVVANPVDAPTTSESEPPPTTAADREWTTILAQLDAVRADAFASGDPALLSSVYVDGTPALERETAALHELTAAGVHAVDLRFGLDEVSLVRTEGDEAILRVVDRLPGYRLVRTDGSVVELRPARGPMAWLVTLRGGSDGGGWRIAAWSSDHEGIRSP